MEKLKVKVNNEAESKEAQELFFNLGVSWRGSDSRNPIVSSLNYPFFVVGDPEGLYLTDSKLFTDFKKTTLQELRDMVVFKHESINDKIATAEVARQEEKHSHYKKDVSHLNIIDPYRIADLYALHPCADHIMKKSLCAGSRGHKDMLRDIQDIIDTAERWKQMIKEDNSEI